jgi:hypothetical protein
VPSITLTQLSTQVLDQLDGNTGEFPSAQVTAVINQALARLNCLVGIQSATIPVPGFTQSNQFQYAVPAGIFIPVRFDFEGDQLTRMSLDRLARAYPSWASDYSAYTYAPAHAASIDLQNFVIHPADSSGGGLLEVTGIVPTTPLVNPGDVVQLDNEFTEILVAYAKPRLLAKEGGKAFADAWAAYKPFQKKIRSMSIWSSIQWSQIAMAVQQRFGNQRSAL